MIRSISIDKFGDIDSLRLQLKKFHQVDVSSGEASLLTMLLALNQSYLPGHAYDWQYVMRPGASSFGNGKLAVRGKLFDGGTFARCLKAGSSYCSCMLEFVIENPENPVEDESAHEWNGRAGAEQLTRNDDAAKTCNAPTQPSRYPYADRKRAGADDFRELCRLFGEKFANVRRFALGIEVSFAEKDDDNILSYQMVSVRCERVWDEDITSFFELVLYRNGTNYDLYWDELPDINGSRTSGHAKGCNVRMRNLEVLDIVSDGVQDGARFEAVLPSVVRVSRIAADQFGTLRFLLDVGQQLPVRGPCYYVGPHGEYTETVVRSFTEGKIRVAWPDPTTGRIRHGLFAEAYKTWKNEIEGLSRDDRKIKTGSPGRDRTEEAALVQGLILRTGETMVLSGDAGLPEKFFAFLSGMGRQIIQIQSSDPEDLAL